MRRVLSQVVIVGGLLCAAALAAHAQELTREKVSGPLSGRRALGGIDHQAIGYSSQPFDDAADRTAPIEILRDTKPELPAYFR